MGENLGCRHVSSSAPDWHLACAYAHLVATSGAAFALSWQPGWQDGNSDLRYISDAPEAAFRHAFESVGCDYSVLHAEAAGKDALQAAIVESVHGAGHPAIAFGVVGPPAACLVTGYEEAGEVLVGWSCFQDDPEFTQGITFEETGEYRQRDWFAHTDHVYIVGEKQERPDQKEADRKALSFGLEVMRTPITDVDRRNGLAAYVAWADTILRDADLVDMSEGDLRHRHLLHHIQVGDLAEARWYGSNYLARVAGDNDRMAPALYAAASCFAQEHRLMWDIWNLAGGIGNKDAYLEFAKPGVRRDIAAIILESRTKCAEAAGHIERALAV